MSTTKEKAPKINVLRLITKSFQKLKLEDRASAIGLFKNYCDAVGDEEVDALRIIAKSFQKLKLEDRDIAIELFSIYANTVGEEKKEAHKALLEIFSPEEAFADLAEEQPVDEDAEKRVLAYRKKVGREIRKRRIARGMTQTQLAESAKLPQSHVSRLESGRHVPTHITIKRLAKALRTQPRKLDPGFGE